MKKPREQDHYRPIIEFLALHHIPAFRLNSGMVQTINRSWVRLAPEGASDIVGVIPPAGRWLCIECKLKPGGKPTPAQQAWLDGMRRAGALVILASDVKGVEAALRAEGVI